MAHDKDATVTKDRVMDIVIRDIESGGPIFKAILKRLHKAIRSDELRLPQER